MNVPADRHAVLSDDGRVFYDLDHLVSLYACEILLDEMEARDEENIAQLLYLAGQSDLITGIEVSIPAYREQLST